MSGLVQSVVMRCGRIAGNVGVCLLIGWVNELIQPGELDEFESGESGDAHAA
jgi:hypothetical protein